MVHGSDLVEVREVNSLSVLYRVRGSEAGKLPYVLTGHLDVVPAVPDKWTQPPFSGNVIDGFIYGRGAIDDKGSVMVLYLSFFSIPAFHFFFYLSLGHHGGVGVLAQHRRQTKTHFLHRFWPRRGGKKRGGAIHVLGEFSISFSSASKD